MNKKDLLLEKLGLVGRERFFLFTNEYKEGWGEKGAGKAANKRSSEELLKFLEKLPKSDEVRCLFFNQNGFFELYLKNTNTDIEFGEHSMEIFTGTGEEITRKYD